MAKILVVDDDAKVLAATGDALAAFGYDPHLISSPEEALALLKKNPTGFDVIILDWKLQSTIDGDMMIKLVKRIFPNFKTPIIFLTAHTNISSKYLMRLGAFDTLSKPFQAEQLVDSIERALQRKPAEDPHRKAPADLSADEFKKHEIAKRIIDAVSSTRSLVDAAAKLGCSRRSLYRWLEKTGLHTFVVEKES